MPSVNKIIKYIFSNNLMSKLYIVVKFDFSNEGQGCHIGRMEAIRRA
jgi:hypothetical protein